MRVYISCIVAGYCSFAFGLSGVYIEILVQVHVLFASREIELISLVLHNLIIVNLQNY